MCHCIMRRCMILVCLVLHLRRSSAQSSIGCRLVVVIVLCIALAVLRVIAVCIGNSLGVHGCNCNHRRKLANHLLELRVRGIVEIAVLLRRIGLGRGLDRSLLCACGRQRQSLLCCMRWHLAKVLVVLHVGNRHLARCMVLLSLLLGRHDVLVSLGRGGLGRRSLGRRGLGLGRAGQLGRIVNILAERDLGARALGDSGAHLGCGDERIRDILLGRNSDRVLGACRSADHGVVVRDHCGGTDGRGLLARLNLGRSEPRGCSSSSGRGHNPGCRSGSNRSGSGRNVGARRKQAHVQLLRLDELMGELGGDRDKGVGARA
eukprot:comp21257_c0_seq1/m.45449 comp21257_c0_seq1/g.45449  ORF comp21257_c0_seq1/g.45449 comp21257_c0_seq1/m.45449 type:complete len:318 (+) comp21257_c0_seq1:163-1116(+)